MYQPPTYTQRNGFQGPLNEKCKWLWGWGKSGTTISRIYHLRALMLWMSRRKSCSFTSVVCDDFIYSTNCNWKKHTFPSYNNTTNWLLMGVYTRLWCITHGVVIILQLTGLWWVITWDCNEFLSFKFEINWSVWCNSLNNISALKPMINCTLMILS